MTHSSTSVSHGETRLGFHMCQNPEVLPKYSHLPSQADGSLWLHTVFPPGSFWKCAMKWAWLTLLGQGSPWASVFHSLAEGKHLLWRGAFYDSKNSVGDPSVWINVFIKNYQSHSAVGLGWLLLLAHQNYCQPKRATAWNQTINTFTHFSFSLLFFAGAFLMGLGVTSHL